MTATDLVNNIQKNQPDLEYYKRIFDITVFNEFKQEFDIPATKNIPLVQYDNEIMNFVLNYDVSAYRPFEQLFDKELYETEDEIFFGWDIYGDRLGINKSTREVFSYNIEGDIISFYCAPNDLVFLEVLFETHLFRNETTVLQEEDELLLEASERYINKISSLLIDPKYVEYYKVLINYE